MKGDARDPGKRRITAPLNLQEEVGSPSRKLDFVPFLDIVVLAFGFFLLSSKFVFAPGITIDLPRVQQEDLAGVAAHGVLTIGTNEMLLFEGSILDFEEFGDHLREYFSGVDEPAILIRADRTVSLQTIMRVAALARAAGVQRVQVAAEADRGEPGDSIWQPVP